MSAADSIKKWGGIAGAALALIALAGTVAAWGDSLIDRRVQIKLAEMVKKDDLQALTRKLNGVQERVNTGTSDNRVIKEKLQHIEQQQIERTQSIEKQLNLIIKLIEQRQ
jgi:hypothetical protein